MAEFLNNNIKYLREIRGLSQQGLADKVGIDRTTISRIENNKIDTTVENAIKIAEAFGISLNDLVGRDLRLNTEPPAEINIFLKEKGLMDNNNLINKKNLNKLSKIVDIINSLENDEKE